MRKILVVSIGALVVGFASCKHEVMVPDFPETFSEVCDPDTVYFANDILPLISSSCAQPGCHDANSATRGINLSSYDALRASGVVNPGFSEESKIMDVLQAQDLGDIMPPPSTMINLTDEQINMVATWIDQGARPNACTDLICDSVDISFSDHVLPIIEQNCKGCHLSDNSSGGFPLTNYDEIAGISSYALIQVMNHDSGFVQMPPNQPKLDSCKLQLVRVWIEEGAQNN